MDGDLNVLLTNIREKLLILPGDTIVYPGHGENTTIAYEKLHNPFLQGRY
jgi:glyoxylase-like metal-dependent hydrolase (beta-lactamase superfamily II)